MDAKYWCTFINKRHAKVIVTTPEGTAICAVPPGEKKRICSWDAKFLWARFDHVTYLPDGKVEFDFNSDWKDPWASEGRHTIELLNLTKPNQIILIDGEPKVALCGIPTLVPISTNDSLIETARLIWKLVTRKFASDTDPRYAVKVTKVEQVKEPRGRREMRAIRKAIQLTEEAKVKEALDHRFPSMKGPTDETAS
jgi:hypothetical protein